MSFQENLRMLRERAGYTSAKDFAEIVGISYPTYMGYENRGREPKYETLCRIAATLHVSIDELLGYTLNEYAMYKGKLISFGFNVEEYPTNTNNPYPIHVVINDKMHFGYKNRSEFITGIKEALRKFQKDNIKLLPIYLDMNAQLLVHTETVQGLLANLPPASTADQLHPEPQPPAADTKNTSRKKRTTKKGTPSADQ